MMALLLQFVDPANGPPGMQLLVLGAVQKATGFVILGTTALAAGRATVSNAVRAGSLGRRALPEQ